ncbi:PKD domain-containing protein [Schleiferiaceae bacterium]|nr:PKD domain-containing protein [Schleiferiaceae bacterium]MDA8661795.1 PKD domain-containing protein [Schleiferiaceae bacterium]
MRLRFLLAFLLPVGLYSQTTIVNMPINGSTDTTNDCSGILVDGGGINGNYTSNNNGYVIIDPPGNDTVTLTFSAWSLYHSSDFIQLYDGVGTSSTYLGYYSSSSTPTTITANSGALTVRFYTNYWGNASGFVASWSTSGNTAPTANFTYAAQSQNYNTPIQFVNTSNNGGVSYWDFGDGTTSTAQNPTHSYTTSGVQTITLVESNCNTSDTTTSNITIATGPNLQAFDDTIEMTVQCGTIGTEYWTLTNGANAGVLNASFEISDTNGTQRLHFDNDDEGVYFSTGSSGTATRSTSAAQGSHSLQLTNNVSNNRAHIPVAGGGIGYQPTYFSYKTRATTTGYRAGLTSLASGFSTNANIFGYTFWYSNGSLGLRIRTSSGTASWEYISNTLGSWAHIEYKNIDWTNQTYDLYIDGSYHNSYKFLNSFSYATHVNMVNYYSTDVSYVDDIQVGNGPSSAYLTISPNSTTILGGNSSTMSLTFDATDLTAGIYVTNLLVTSNDTTIHNDTVPVLVTIEGDYEFNTLSDTLDFGNVATGKVFNDSMMVLNTGCADLQVDSLLVVGTDFIASMNSIPYADTGYVYAQFTAPTAGTFIDSFVVYTQDSSFTRYFKAVGFDAPSIALDSTIFNVSVNGCPDTVDVSYWIYNDGQQSLTFENVGIPTSAPPACPFTIQLTDSYGDGWNGAKVDLIDTDGNVLYTLGTSFYSGYSYNESVLLCSGETYRIVVTATGSYKSEIGLNVVENGTTIASYTNTSATNLGTQMAQFSANCGIPCSNPSTLIFDPTNGSIASGDSQLVQMKIYTDSLVEGTYTYSAYVNSNDPVDSAKMVTVNLTIDGVSETYINRNICFDLDTIVKGGTYVDSVFVENIGCDSLYFNSISTTVASFSAAATYSQIGVGDSGWVIVTINPTSTGTISDTVFINTSDTTWPLCYTGYIAEAPSAWVQTSPINISTQNCSDSVNFDLLLGNSTANTNLNWSISSGEVLNILLVNSNVYPSLWNNFQTYLTTVEDIAVKTVTSTSAVISELSWADIVIFPPVTNSSASSDYTAIQTDMSDWINDGGKMLIMGSTNVGNILAMNFITGYYYGNYTGYTHYVNSSYYNHPYVQGVSTSFVPQSAALDAYIYNTGYVYLVYNTYYRQALSYFPLGDGEVIYYGFNFNTVYADMTKILDNIFESTLSDKATGVNWLSFNPTTGTASGGDTTTVSGTAYSDTLPAGVYNLNINVTTNDPTNPSFSIPVTFTVNGQGEGMMDNSCVNFGSVYQNMTHNEDVQVYNVGCDTLFISSASTGGSAFTTSSISLAIAPGDTGMVPVSLYQTSLGTVNDTLYVYSSVDTVQRCLTANVVGASDISVAPASIEVTINKCNGFATVPYTITNNGQAQLSYAVDVAEIYDSSYTQTWLYPAPNYSNTLVYNFNNIIDSDTIFYEIILNGEYSQTNNYFYLYANGSYMQTVYDNNVSNYTNDTISGFITGWQLTNIMNAGYLTVQLYSYNYNSVSGQTCQVHVWQRDDVTWASPVGAATGTLAAGNSVSKSILVTVSNLALGTYYSSVVFETNDPQDPVYQVPMTVHVVSEPDMVLGANAINYGNVYNTTPVIDSVLVENDGCTDLTISNVNSNNTHFVPSWTSKVIAAGASAWLDVTFTATTATQQTGILTITNNDSIQYVNLAANVIFAPDADYQYQVQNACNGEVSFINESTNGSQYFWAFGDGTFSAAVNPTHNYSKPGTYQVMLVTSNAGGSDTLYKNVALNDILYVASEFPDTVQAGTTVQFIDSSMYANSWQWYFGDGGNATSPNPQHTYANKGTFIVTLLVTNSAGCSGSDNDAIIVTSGIGIDEQAFEAVLYPNPTSALLHIDCTAAERIILYSNTGAQILDIPFVEDVDLSNIPAGTYQVVLRGSNGVWRETISVVR